MELLLSSVGSVGRVSHKEYLAFGARVEVEFEPGVGAVDGLSEYVPLVGEGVRPGSRPRQQRLGSDEVRESGGVGTLRLGGFLKRSVMSKFF